MHEMRTMHLFAGAGGGLLADLILGHEPVVAVEWDAYCCRVLRERAADGWFPGLRVWEGDVRMFDPSEYAGEVDCIHAGFPCQPFSVAGQRLGESDERNMWPATIEIIRRLRPPFAFLENVPGLLTTGYFGRILGDLSEGGYDCVWKVLSAAEVGAPHKRDRLWIMAHARGARMQRWRSQCRGQGSPRACGQFERSGKYTVDVANPYRNGRQSWRPECERQQRQIAPECACSEVADTDRAGCEEQHTATVAEGQGHCSWRDGAQRPEGWWATEPDVGRVAHGVASRVDRLKALGNGQVPLQAAVAFKILWRMMEAA